LESEHGQLPDLIIRKKQLAFLIEVKHRWNGSLIGTDFRQLKDYQFEEAVWKIVGQSRVNMVN
jgi:hypothetical protein